MGSYFFFFKYSSFWHSLINSAACWSVSFCLVTFSFFWKQVMDRSTGLFRNSPDFAIPEIRFSQIGTHTYSTYGSNKLRVVFGKIYLSRSLSLLHVSSVVASGMLYLYVSFMCVPLLVPLFLLTVPCSRAVLFDILYICTAQRTDAFRTT